MGNNPSNEKPAVSQSVLDKCDGCEKADPQFFYRLIWADLKVNNDENKLYQECLKHLGYKL